MTAMLPVSAIVPTYNRSAALKRALQSLAAQSSQPSEILVIDASKDSATKSVCESAIPQLQSKIRWAKANIQGAAAQRNQGAAIATHPHLCFFDDDITFEPECISRLWSAIHSDSKLGGVNAMIVNQSYHSPGLISRIVFIVMNGKSECSFAGRVIGPAINLLPENRDDLPEVVRVDWLNLGCTIYRRDALPNPPFRIEFTGYSLMEDLALSLEVGKKWKLANARTARVFHDSQPGDYKSDADVRSCMELLNRHFIMTVVLSRHGFVDYAKLLIWEFFSVISTVFSGNPQKNFNSILRGKWRALRTIAAK